jgi:hypothetical protein
LLAENKGKRPTPSPWQSMCNDWNKILDFAITGNNKKQKQMLLKTTVMVNDFWLLLIKLGEVGRDEKFSLE